MKTEIINISKSFGKKQILKDVCIESESGECVGILGTNGSGKSTLFSILTGILKSDGGDFLCDGESLFKNTKKRSIMWSQLKLILFKSMVKTLVI